MARSKTPTGFPHIGNISDVPTKDALRVIMDQLHSHERRNTELDATIEDLQSRIHTLTTTSNQALSLAKSNTYARSIVKKVTGVLSGSSTGGTDDGGRGAAGCSVAGADGHVDADSPMTLETVGKICCGVGHEFPTLLAPAVDQPTRDANAVELLGRMIWHLQLAGFSAGKQQNPSLAISTDKLTVLIGTVWWAYDVFSLTAYTDPMTTHMVPVGSPNTVADTGVAD